MSGRVLVDDHCLTNRGGGIRTYTEALFRHWPRTSPVQLVGFRGGERPAFAVDRSQPVPIALRPLTELFPRHTFPHDSSHRKGLLFHAYRAAFRLHARLGHYDAVFQPNNLCPSTLSPMIATLHDLSVFEHPEWHTAGRVARWKCCLPAAIRHTRHWISPSAFTRDRMISLLHIEPHTIHVIPEAARPLPPPADDWPLASKRYLLFVGTIEPRKNLPLLLDAYAQLPSEVRAQHPLLLVGPAGWGPPDYWHALTQHPVSREVLVTGYLSDGQLAAAFAHAAALLLPSLYEGFGLQVLEAMAAGCPVICSDIPVFREVAGDSAELLPLQNTAAWSASMHHALHDQDWRAAQTLAGKARAAQFSWPAAAAQHAALFAQVARGHA